MAAEVVVEIGGVRHGVDDPELAALHRYLVKHARRLRLREMRTYVLEVERTARGRIIRPKDTGVPFDPDPVCE